MVGRCGQAVPPWGVVSHSSLGCGPAYLDVLCSLSLQSKR